MDATAVAVRGRHELAIPVEHAHFSLVLAVALAVRQRVVGAVRQRRTHALG